MVLLYYTIVINGQWIAMIGQLVRKVWTQTALTVMTSALIEPNNEQHRNKGYTSENRIDLGVTI